MVEQQVALQLGAGVAAGQHEVDIEAKLCAGGGGLPAVVGLHAGAPNDQVGALRERLAEQELVVAGLVAAEGEAGAVVALDDETRAAEMGGKARHLLQRGGQVRERHARKMRGAAAQLGAGGGAGAGRGVPGGHQPDTAAGTGCRLGVRSSSVCGHTMERCRGVSRASSSGDGW